MKGLDITKTLQTEAPTPFIYFVFWHFVKRKFRPRLHRSGQIFAWTKPCTVPLCVYTGPAELNKVLTAKCASLGRAFFRSQTYTLSRSKIRPALPVPCKRKVKPGKFLSVQVFVRAKICSDPCECGLKNLLVNKQRNNNNNKLSIPLVIFFSSCGPG